MNEGFKEDPDVRRKFGIGLIVLAVVIGTGLFLPWTQISAEFNQTKINGTIKMSVNGLGRGSFSTNLKVETDRGVQRLQDSYNVFLPSYFVFSTPLLLVAIINLAVGIHLSSDRVNLPIGAGECIDETWPQILLLTTGVAIVSVISFGFFYFAVPSVGTTSLSMRDHLKNLVYFSKHIKAITGALKQRPKLSVSLGVGYLLATAASVGLVYMCYLYYQYKHDWAKLWKVRGFLLPLLILLPFFPWMHVVNQAQVSLQIGLFVPLGGSPIGGIVYLLVALITLVLVKVSADTTNKLEERVQKSYQISDATDEEVAELINAIEAQRTRLKTLKTLLIPLVLGLLLLAFFLLQSMMALNSKFVQIRPVGAVLTSSSAYWPGWLLWMGPLGLILTFALFRH